MGMFQLREKKKKETIKKKKRERRKIKEPKCWTAKRKNERSSEQGRLLGQVKSQLKLCPLITARTGQVLPVLSQSPRSRKGMRRRPDTLGPSTSPPRQHPGQRPGGRREGRAMIRSGFIRLDIIIFK